MNNELQEHHVMVLENTHPSGVEEWYCPICGRRFLMQWPPKYKKIILEAGNENAIHSGGKGGIRMGVQFVQDQEEDSSPPMESSEVQEDVMGSVEDEELLKPWQEWMDRVNFDDLWRDG